MSNIRYDGRPTVGYTASTTQFDDELIKRGIISREQAIYRKGATSAEAAELAAKANAPPQEKLIYDIANPGDGMLPNQVGISYEDDEYLDDGILEAYRRQRIHEIKNDNHVANGNRYGEVIPISRPEWQAQVNEASHSSWVIVCLTNHGDSDRTAHVEHSLHELAEEFPNAKFVKIPSHQAIPNWPDANLPSIFLYRHGIMKHEMLRLDETLDTDELRNKLEILHVL